MLNKLNIGKKFSKTCRYVCGDSTRAIVLDAEGVRAYNWKFMSEDFERQHALRPSLNKAVFHGILSFYPGESIEDRKMVAIAREYLEKTGISDTQYSITRHIDTSHSHLHIIANLVNNKRESIKVNWIGFRAAKVCRELNRKYGLKEATSKNLSITHFDRLPKKDLNRYVIYQGVLEMLPQSKSMDDLKENLAKINIEILYRYEEQTNKVQGIIFKLGDYKYKGSRVDKMFSARNLERLIYSQQLNSLINASPASLDSKLLSKKI